MAGARRRTVMVVGLTLAAACGGSKVPERTGNPPPPDPVPPEEPVEAIPEATAPDDRVKRNPPPPPPDPVVADLPSWDEVKSRHPPGATNPPRPVLIVTPEGRCYKSWVSPMAPPTPGVPRGDRVQACDGDCGTEVVCPERAEALLEAHRAEATE